jgi:hypothetical protein
LFLAGRLTFQTKRKALYSTRYINPLLLMLNYSSFKAVNKAIQLSIGAI